MGQGIACTKTKKQERKESLGSCKTIDNTEMGIKEEVVREKAGWVGRICSSKKP